MVVNHILVGVGGDAGRIPRVARSETEIALAMEFDAAQG
jgi:hypothetical protein